MNLLYSNYGITYNSKIKVSRITELLVKAYEKEQEDGLWEMWKLQFPNMDENNFISFEDYKAKFMRKERKQTNLTYEEIEEEMAKVEKAFKERR